MRASDAAPRAAAHFRGEDFDRCRAAANNKSTADPPPDNGCVAIFGTASTQAGGENILAVRASICQHQWLRPLREELAICDSWVHC
jgi:hypothetical protein